MVLVPSDNVTKLRASDGMALGTYPVGDRDVVVWVMNKFSHIVSKLQAFAGITLIVYAVGDATACAILEGGNLWVASFGSRSVTKLRASDGTRLAVFESAAAR